MAEKVKHSFYWGPEEVTTSGKSKIAKRGTVSIELNGEVSLKALREAVCANTSKLAISRPSREEQGTGGRAYPFLTGPEIKKEIETGENGKPYFVGAIGEMAAPPVAPPEVPAAPPVAPPEVPAAPPVAPPARTRAARS